MLLTNKINISWAVLLLAFSLLIFGNERVLGSLPFYTLDFLLVGIFVATAWKYSFKFSVRQKTILVLLAVFLCAALGSAVSNNFTFNGAGLLKSWFFLPVVVLGLFFSRNDTEHTRQRLLSVWFYGLLVLLLIGIVWWIMEVVTFDGRLIGTFSSPNFLGYLLFPGVVLSWYMARVDKTPFKFFFWLTGILFLVLVLDTKSLGALLAVVASLCFFQFVFIQNFVRSHLGKSLLIAGTLFITPTALFFEDQLMQNFGERSSVASRIMIWKSSWSIAKESPLLGIGVGKFQENYLLHQPKFPPYLEWAVPEPHNIFLAFWFSTGLIGVCVIGVLLWLALSSQNITPERRALEAILFGTLVYGLFDTPALGNALAFVWWCNLLVLLLVSEKIKEIPH